MNGDLDIKFFPSDRVKNGFIGGGYITSGVLKCSFSVFLNTKNPCGFNISLPSTREADGSWKNHVEFKNNDAKKIVSDFITPRLGSLLSGGSAEQTVVAINNTPSQVQIQSNANQIGTPF